MKTIGMIFNTEMVRDLLNGIQTVTRRKAKKEITYSKDGGFHCCGYMHGIGFTHEETMRNFTSSKYAPVHIGDEIYVKETFCKGRIYDSDSGHPASDFLYVEQCLGDDYVIYKQSCLDENIEIDEVKWKASSVMTKELSRITLKVTNVRVERSRDIAEDEENPFQWVIEFKVIKPL